MTDGRNAMMQLLNRASNESFWPSINPLLCVVEEEPQEMILHVLECVVFKSINALKAWLRIEVGRHVIVDLKSKANFNNCIAGYFYHMYGYPVLCDAGFSDDADHAYVAMRAAELVDHGDNYRYWSKKLHAYVVVAEDARIYKTIEECKIRLMLDEGVEDVDYEDVQIDRFIINGFWRAEKKGF